MTGNSCTRVIKKSRSEKIATLMEPRRKRFLRQRETADEMRV
jgi:hypothetical protein